jgi:hypothetical protein
MTTTAADIDMPRMALLEIITDPDYQHCLHQHQSELTTNLGDEEEGE